MQLFTSVGPNKCAGKYCYPSSSLISKVNSLGFFFFLIKTFSVLLEYSHFKRNRLTVQCMFTYFI